MGSIGNLIFTIGASVEGFTQAIASVDSDLVGLADKATSAGTTFDEAFLKKLGIANDTLTETAASFKEATTALDPFAEAAHQVGEAISATLPPAFQFSEAAQEIIDKQAGLNAAAQESISHFNEISDAYRQGAASAEDVTRAEHEMHDAIAATKPAVEEAHGGMGEFGHTLTEVAGILGVGIGLEQLVEGLKGVIEESIAAYGKIEMATAALTTLTGSAESAEEILSKMRDISMSSIFAFPDLVQAAQKMAALGVAAEQIPTAMHAVVAAAEGTGNSLDAVSSALDRIYMSATISPRTLTQLGISIKDVAETMGISADKVKETFQALGPQSDDALQILTATIERRMGSAAEAIEGTLPAAMNRLKVQWDLLLEDIGSASAEPVTEAVTNLGQLTSAVNVLLESLSGGKSGGLSVGGVIKEMGADLMSGFGLISAGKEIFTDLAAVIDTAKGKYPNLQAAIAALDAQVTGSTANWIAQDAALASQIIHETEAADKTAKSAQAARDALAAEKNLKEEKKLRAEATKLLSEAENALAAAAKSSYIPVLLNQEDAEINLEAARRQRVDAAAAVKTVEDALSAATAPGMHNTAAMAQAETDLKTARANLKTADTELSEREKDLAASKTLVKDVTALLASADKEYAASMKAIAVPAMIDYNTALQAVSAAKQKIKLDNDEIKASEKALADLMAADGEKDKGAIADATAAISAARAKLKTDTDALKSSETTLNTVRVDTEKVTRAILDGETALDAARAKYVPHLQDLGTEMDNVKAAQANLTQAEKDEADALAVLKSFRDAGITQGPELTNAINNERDAHRGLTDAEKELSAAEQQLQSDWGISASAVQKILDPTRNLSAAAAESEAALVSMGIAPQQHFDDLAKRAADAYNTILKDGTTSPKLVLDAHINALEKQIAAYTASGTDVPAAQQLMLAKLKQQQTDWVTASTTQWTSLYKQIHDTVSGMFSGLVTDLFQGGDFLGTITKAFQKIGEDMVNTVLQPFEKQFTDWISNSLTKLLSGAFSTVFGSGGALGTGIGSLPIGIGSGTSTTIGSIPGLGGAAGGAASGAGGAAGSAGGGAGGAAGSVGSITGIVGAIGSIGSMITGAIGDFQNSTIIGHLFHIMQATEQTDIAVGGAYASTSNSVLGLLYRISDNIQFGNATKDLDVIKDVIAGQLKDDIHDIGQSAHYGLLALGTIRDILQGGLKVSGSPAPAPSTTPAAPTTTTPPVAPVSPTSPGTPPTAVPVVVLPSAPGGSRTDTAQNPPAAPALTPQQAQIAQLQAQQKDITAILATLQDSYSKAVGQYQTDMLAVGTTHDEIVAIKQKIATAMDDLNNANDPTQQQYYRDLLATLQQRLVVAQTQLDDTQVAIVADLQAQTDLKQQIADTYAKLTDLLATIATAQAATKPPVTTTASTNDTSGLPSAPGGSRTDTAQHPTGPPTIAEILTDMSGQIFGALHQLIPQGWSMDQFGNWINTLADIPTQLRALNDQMQLQGPLGLLANAYATPVVPAAVTVQPAPAPSAASWAHGLTVKVLVDGRELSGAIIQSMEESGTNIR